MERYIGVKIINAKEMNRLEYNKFRGWELPSDENGSDEGYLVEYIDGGKANTKEYKGYVSWSPKEVFERSYRKIGVEEFLTFGLAIDSMKKGCKVSRKGWNGKNMWLWLCNVEGEWESKEGETYQRLPYIYMKTADNKVVPWLASQTDMLSEDWEIVK